MAPSLATSLKPSAGVMASSLSTAPEPSAGVVPVDDPSVGSGKVAADVVPSSSDPSMSAAPSAQEECTLEKEVLMEDKVVYFDRMSKQVCCLVSASFP